MSARLYHVKRAQSAYSCLKCGQQIEPGTSYVWFKFRFGGKRRYHDTPSCRPSADERESNAKVAAHRRIGEYLDSARGFLESDYNPNGANEELSNAATEAREIAEELQTTYDAWQGTNLAYSETANRYEEMVSEFESFADDCENLASDCDALSSQEPEEPGEEPDEPNPDDFEDGEADTDYQAESDEYETWKTTFEAYEDWKSEVESKASELPDVPELELPSAPRQRRRKKTPQAATEPTE